jgi:hypothetical protein
MRLVDEQGNIVFLSKTYGSDGSRNNYEWEFARHDEATNTMVPVTEAIAAKGTIPRLPRVYAEKVFKDAVGLDWVELKWDREGYLDIDRESGWHGLWHSANRKQWHKVCGREVSKAVDTKIWKTAHEFNRWNGGMRDSWYSSQGPWKHNMSVETMLDIHGIGTVFTAESLSEGKAKGASDLPYHEGCWVKFSIRGKGEGEGRLVAVQKKAKIYVRDDCPIKPDKDGHVRASWTNVTNLGKAPKSAVRADLESLDPTIRAGFERVLAHKERLYRAKLKKSNWTFPLFPREAGNRTEQQDRRDETDTCECPVCGWVMAEHQEWREDGKFICCFCRQTAHIVSKTSDEITLYMAQRPDKNRFAPQEAQCCANCGLFEFETGRQGKRTTGYCRTSNQCLQAYNTCEWWFPRDGKRFGSNMKQHGTNLKYGVEDWRNTSRQDIRDTIYRQEDHDKEVKKLESTKAAYSAAWQQFVDDLQALAEETPLYDKVPEAVREEFGKLLDRGGDDGEG